MNYLPINKQNFFFFEDETKIVVKTISNKDFYIYGKDFIIIKKEKNHKLKKDIIYIFPFSPISPLFRSFVVCFFFVDIHPN
uniref:MSP domain-containing protein n=1 Tax=Parastrongyloides trichosuri TaxID=131310 RepID=A0A0N4Z9H9_PARTI